MSARLAYTPAKIEPSLNLSRQQIWPTGVSGGQFRFADKEESASFGPFEHLCAIHPSNGRRGGHRKGQVVFGQRVYDGEKHWQQWAVDISEAPHIAKEIIERQETSDFYVSMQSFFGRRRLENLASIGCAFSDIDYRTKSRWAKMDPQTVLSVILDALDENKIPPPSYAMDSGRGLYLVWLHELLPPAALKRWDLVQSRINETLQPFGADKMAKDASRVLRVAGSINSRAEWERRQVQLFWIQGNFADPYRYIFDDLADEILPYTREQVASLSAERVKRKASQKGQSVKPRSQTDSASYGETVLEDLERLRMHRYSSGLLPAGERDAWLFCAVMALAWTCHPQALESEAVRIASNVSGWSRSEAKSQMGSILRRARDAAAGKKIMFNGKEIDPRYRMKATTVIEWLTITSDEQVNAGLRILLNADVRRERKARLERERRQRNGATSHSVAAAERLRIGQIALYRMVKEGFTRNEMALELGVSTGQLSKALREAREVA